MEPFGNFKHREGITMVTEAGRMRYRKTAFNLAPATFLKDVNRLDLDPYDLIACDYEPVTAWAAKARARGYWHWPSVRFWKKYAALG